MAAPDNIIDELIRDEGWEPSAYQDSEGYWTIGSGICIDKRMGCGITPEENAMLIGNRLAKVKVWMASNYPWTNSLDPVRLAVLWNMGYNLGPNRFAGFRNFLASMQAGNWQMAALNMLNSAWATQVGDRAKRLAEQVETGEW